MLVCGTSLLIFAGLLALQETHYTATNVCVMGISTIVLGKFFVSVGEYLGSATKSPTVSGSD